MTEPEVLITERDGVGRVTLNRPKAINALSHGMVATIYGALLRWQQDDQIQTVLLDGAGERGFCAGGDVRALYEDALAGGGFAQRFWTDEYRLNATIARYEKPIVALMDGLVMGGGVGLACHCSHRVVSETSAISMPEVTIGFTPDVGGTFLLARAPGELGTHLALTSAQMTAADAVLCGFADVFVPVERRDELITTLAVAGADAALEACSTAPPPGRLAAIQESIDQCYTGESIEEIIAALHERSHHELATQLSRLSPTALKVTLRSLRLARNDVALEQSLQRELRVSVHSLTSHDFIEGIRAQIIDKDRDPQWLPSTLADVTAADVDRFFLPLADGDPSLSLAQLPEG